MITHSFYECDNRVMRYAETLAQRGDSVEVIALRNRPDLPSEEVMQGVRLYRIQDRLGKQEQSLVSLLWPLLRFLFAASRQVNLLHRQQPFDVIHVHNVPDFLVFAALIPKLRGAKVVLDIHDIMPELFGSRSGRSEGSIYLLALKVVERISAKVADRIILANHLWLTTYTARSAPREKCSVFINNVDLRVFHSRARTRNDGKLIVMFPGGLQAHQGLDIAIRALKTLAARLPNLELHIYGDGNMKPQLMTMARDLGLNGTVRFFDPLGLSEIAGVMAEADLGVVPKRVDSFGNEAYSTKIMEFMALGVPLVVSSTKIDRYYFNDSVVRFFESGNSDQMAEAMFELLTNDELRRTMIKNASEYVSLNNWETRKGDYLQLVDSLCESREQAVVNPARRTHAP